MTILLIIIHVVACIALIGIVLIQRGRGGGLVESFSSVESMFGPKTSAFLTKSTSVLSVVFFITCLSLAILSVKQSRSLMRGVDGRGAPRTDMPQTSSQTADRTDQAQPPAQPESKGLAEQAGDKEAAKTSQ